MLAEPPRPSKAFRDYLELLFLITPCLLMASLLPESIGHRPLAAYYRHGARRSIHRVPAWDLKAHVALLARTHRDSAIATSETTRFGRAIAKAHREVAIYCEQLIGGSH